MYKVLPMYKAYHEYGIAHLIKNIFQTKKNLMKKFRNLKLILRNYEGMVNQKFDTRSRYLRPRSSRL